MIYKGYKYRIYPNKVQTKMIEKSLGCYRFVYNLALETKKRAFSDYGVNLTTFDLCYQLNGLKELCPWLKEVDSQALQASVKTIDSAYKKYFNDLKSGKIDSLRNKYLSKQKNNGQQVNWHKYHNIGKPKFKSKKGHNSFRCPNCTRRVNWEQNTLDIPKIFGIPIVLTRKFEGNIKTVTISKTPTGKYYASVLVEQNIILPKTKKPTLKGTLGIDVGLTDYITLSNGKTKIDNPRYLKETMGRIKIMQYRLSKKKKGSNNSIKYQHKIATKHEKVTNQRQDFLHKISYRIVNDNQVNTIAVEGLQISNMVKNHKLAQSISDAAWGKLFEYLKYKCGWYGKNYVEIGAFEKSTSQCSNCQHQVDKMPLSIRTWVCPNCNTQHHRDGNAANVIKQKGFKQLTELLTNSGVPRPKVPVEVPAIAGPMKQELSYNTTVL